MEYETSEVLKITGALTVTLFDKNGNVKDKRDAKNLVVSAGKTFIASSMTKNNN